MSLEEIGPNSEVISMAYRGYVIMAVSYETGFLIFTQTRWQIQVFVEQTVKGSIEETLHTDRGFDNVTEAFDAGLSWIDRQTHQGN